jgi:hypothetical protein
VLLITPRIIRNIPLPVSGKSEIFSGTQSALGADPIQLRALSNSALSSVSTVPSGPTDNASDPALPLGNAPQIETISDPAPPSSSEQ